VQNVAPRRRRQHNFSFSAKRRREIVLHARRVGAAETDDFSRWLIAWLWHCKAKDQIWAVMEAAKSMGGKITEAEASAVTEETSITRKHLTADNLARFLGVTYAERQALHLTTIGSVNVSKRARKALRRDRNLMAKERKRRKLGARPRAEYEANSIAAQARAEGVSRMTIYRRKRAEQAKNRPDVTGAGTAIFLSSEDRPVTPERVWRGCPSGAVAPKQGRGLPCSHTATTIAADRYVISPAALKQYVGTHARLPLELRMMALGLAA
jgi:hypothetical protein